MGALSQATLSGNDLFSGILSAARILPGTDFRTTDRDLAPSWRQRAAANIEAIRMSRRISAEGRNATPEEQQQLAKFVGFGASDLANNLLPTSGLPLRKGWGEIAIELRSVTSRQELDAIKASTQYAHYTPENIAAAVWAGARRIGFSGGKALEAGCGIGLFPAMVPADLDPHCRFTGIEVEPVTARIAGLLQPNADIRCESFADTVLPPNFNLAIGNPPFSRTSLTATDPAGKLGLGMHDYFIAKNISLLATGGVAAFVVSRWTMDKSSGVARQHIASMADFLGAIRLPQGAMRDKAGTDVVVDLMFFRRRETGAEPAGERWFELSTVDCGPNSLVRNCAVNEYFRAHPEMVLGTHAFRTGARGPEYTVWADGRDLDIAMGEAVAALPAAEGATPSLPADAAEPEPDLPRVRVGTAADGARLKEGSYFVDAGDAEARKTKLYDLADRASGTERKRLLKQAAGVVSQEKLYRIVNHQPVEVLVKRKGQGGIDGIKDEKRPSIYRSNADIIRALIPVRDAVRDVVSAQEADAPWQEAQRRLNLTYDAFVALHGPINKTIITRELDEDTGEVKDRVRRPNLAPFRGDPDCWLVASIEEHDQDTGRAAKGPIFSRRVILPPPEAVIKNPSDALAVVLNEIGRADMARIAELLECSETEAASRLGDTVFLDPETTRWQTADAYLSGGVRVKLRAAEAAAADDDRFQRNVEALRVVQPADLVPAEITVRLGAPWIPADDVRAFIFETIGVSAKVMHSVEVAAWTIEKHPFKNHPESKTVWGTHRMHAGELIEHGLNSKVPKVYDKIDDPDGGRPKLVLNPTETQAAEDKLREINQAFSEWVWQDAERTDRLLGVYNNTFNDKVARHFDGRHLMLPGASNAITLRDHQKRAAWRIIATGNTYLAHAVGAGKTSAVTAAVMEQRRLGLVRKAMIAVPSHTLMQWTHEWLRLYPNARILVADDHSFSKDKRQAFIARAATGDFDAVIITHSAFKMIPSPAEFERGLIRQQVREIEAALETLDPTDRVSRKKIERTKESMTEKLKALIGRKDNMMTLKEMGIDQIVVDEAQFFRKLTFATNLSSLRGIDPDGSQMAWDLWVKIRLVETINPGRAIVMASGTPISNTMGELFTVGRYIDPEGQRARGVHEFDAWAANFGEAKTELEVLPSGNYAPATRFALFVNVPELVSMFRAFADVVHMDDIRELLGLPRVKMDASTNSKRQIVEAEASEVFRAYQRLLGDRIEAVKGRGKPQPGDDILLSIITDGRHAVIDMRLVNPLRDILRLPRWKRKEVDTTPFLSGANDNAVSKLDKLIQNAFRIWQQNRHRRYKIPGTDAYYPLPGAAQMIFSDLGTLNAEETRGFSAYAWIRRRLVELGVPAEQIAIIHHFDKPEAKQRLFNDVNAGRVLFLIGSSQKMGTGVNAQQRLIALHHLDAPWLPAEIEQREGRIERQGNQNDEIEIFVYVTLGSLDASMWQTLERKARFIAAALAGDRSVRRVEDAASQADQFAMAKAIASGDQRLMQLAGLESEVGRLRRLRAAHQSQQIAVRRELRNAIHGVQAIEDRMPRLEADAAQYVPTRGEGFSMQVGEQTYADRREAGNALMLALRGMETDRFFGRREVGSVGGFPLYWRRWREDSLVFADVVLELSADSPRIPLMRESVAGLLQRIENRLADIPDELSRAKMALDTLRGRIVSYEGQVGQPFSLAGELSVKEVQLAEVKAALAGNKDEEGEQEAA